MSAEVLVTVSRIAAFCIDLKNEFASVQVWIRARKASASFLRASTTSGAGPARHDQHDRLHLVLEALSVVFSSPFSCGRRSDVLFADLKAFLVSAANQVAPDHVGLDAVP